MNFCKTLRNQLAALLLSTSLTIVAFDASAFDATALIERYQALAATQGQVFTYSSIEATSETSFKLTEPRWKIATISAIKAKSATFSDVVEKENGEITIGSLDVDTISAGSPKVSVNFDSASMKNLLLPSAGETDPIKSLQFYSRFDLGKGTISSADKIVATLGVSYINVTPFDATTPMKMTSEITDITVETSSIPNTEFQKAISDLGYGTKFNGHIAMDATWSLSDGVMEITKYDFIIKDVGTFSMPFGIGGYTAAKMKQMQQMNQEMKGKSEQEQGIASMKLLADLSLRNFTFSFKDDSLTNRGLKLASTKMGQPPEQLAVMAPMMIGIGMGKFNMPKLTEMVSKAIGKFLAKPGTISVNVNPTEPILFVDLASAGASDPTALVKLLNLQVSAQ